MAHDQAELLRKIKYARDYRMRNIVVGNRSNLPNVPELEANICNQCNGSGKGDGDRTVCYACKGSGGVK